jgi:hypothetical protein
MNFFTRKAAAVTASGFVPVVVTRVGLSQKAEGEAKAQQDQAAWSAPPLLANTKNTKKFVSCCPPPLMGMNESSPTNWLLHNLSCEDPTNNMPLAASGPTRPSTCHAFHKGTGTLSTLGENGLTNGLCCVGDGMEAHGKHVSKGLESLGNRFVAASVVVAAAFILSQKK